MEEPSSEKIISPKGSQISHLMHRNNLGEVEGSSLTCFSSPLSSTAVNGEQLDKEFSSAVAWQAELSSLINGRTDFQPETHAPEYFKEVGIAGESAVWCSSDENQGEKSALNSWDSMPLLSPWCLLQDYAPGYDV